ncbi:MAG TPA: homogentisate 1,2-dioxygenase [Candidatus Binatia bacterium]|nr:homogentisate 1,2-dioxygenase [Candidatus Binatia bacterium]
MPTQAREIKRIHDTRVQHADEQVLRHHHFKTKDLKKSGDPVSGRVVLLHNADVSMAIAVPDQKMSYFYRNGQGDDLYFIHEGTGRIQTIFGELLYRPGDYVVIPRGTTYMFHPEAETQRYLVIESASSIETPKRYRNEYGQLLEHAPFSERDIRKPERLETFTEKGKYEVRIKARDQITAYEFDFHPLDVVGWDGFLYPYIFNIEDFEPITGRVHMPPPTHQCFEGRNFVVCSFVPRMYDYHPNALPVPYNHSNVDSDEVLYYVNGNFMSRRGIEVGSFTLHPSGIPHGPHPGAAEASIGAKETKELAVMLDTFHPLYVTPEAAPVDDPQYPYSWIEKEAKFEGEGATG